MEKLILSLCGFWFWLTRKYRATQYREAAEVLEAAYDSLAEDLYSRWSTRDRGYILPFQAEALYLLRRHSALTTDTANRFESLLECCRFVTEELTGLKAEHVLVPQSKPSLQPAFVPAAIPPAARFRFFWNADSSGAAPRPFPPIALRLKPAMAPAEVPRNRAA